MQSTIKSAVSSSRTYLHTIDIHGQLFLADTKLRNFTSAFKDKVFLDFFYDRIRINDAVEGEGVKLREEGFTWVSNCGKERNYIRPDDSVLVFQGLTKDGKPDFHSSRSDPVLPTDSLAPRKPHLRRNASPPLLALFPPRLPLDRLPLPSLTFPSAPKIQGVPQDNASGVPVRSLFPLAFVVGVGGVLPELGPGFGIGWEREGEL